MKKMELNQRAGLVFYAADREKLILADEAKFSTTSPLYNFRVGGGIRGRVKWKLIDIYSKWLLVLAIRRERKASTWRRMMKETCCCFRRQMGLLSARYYLLFLLYFGNFHFLIHLITLQCIFSNFAHYRFHSVLIPDYHPILKTGLKRIKVKKIFSIGFLSNWNKQGSNASTHCHNSCNSKQYHCC